MRAASYNLKLLGLSLGDQFPYNSEIAVLVQLLLLVLGEIKIKMIFVIISPTCFAFSILASCSKTSSISICDYYSMAR
jgi:hypothetical protein